MKRYIAYAVPLLAVLMIQSANAKTKNVMRVLMKDSEMEQKKLEEFSKKVNKRYQKCLEDKVKDELKAEKELQKALEDIEKEKEKAEKEQKELEKKEGKEAAKMLKEQAKEAEKAMKDMEKALKEIEQRREETEKEQAEAEGLPSDVERRLRASRELQNCNQKCWTPCGQCQITSCNCSANLGSWGCSATRSLEENDMDLVADPTQGELIHSVRLLGSSLKSKDSKDNDITLADNSLERPCGCAMAAAEETVPEFLKYIGEDKTIDISCFKVNDSEKD